MNTRHNFFDSLLVVWKKGKFLYHDDKICFFKTSDSDDKLIVIENLTGNKVKILMAELFKERTELLKQHLSEGIALKLGTLAGYRIYEVDVFFQRNDKCETFHGLDGFALPEVNNLDELFNLMYSSLYPRRHTDKPI